LEASGDDPPGHNRRRQHALATMSGQVNKTDKSDAYGLAQIAKAQVFLSNTGLDLNFSCII
jgi:hypothetical protein